MGKVDHMARMYVSMCVRFHWFLLVVDTSKCQLLYLDSLRVKSESRERVLAIKDLAIQLERIFTHDSWYLDPFVPRSTIGDYPVIEPRVNQQKPSSNDCGVWLCSLDGNVALMVHSHS